jgi:hypothetical protein
MLRPIAAQPCPEEWGLGSHLRVGCEGKIGFDWLDMETLPTPTAEALGVAGDRTYFPAEEGEQEDDLDLGTAIA